MAQVTETLIDIEGVVVLTMTYDDVTDLIDEFVLTTDRECTIQAIKNANGQVWREETVQAGRYPYKGGGPVRRLSDLERISVHVEF